MSELKKMMGSMEALVEVEDLEVGPGQEGDLEDPQHILLWGVRDQWADLPKDLCHQPKKADLGKPLGLSQEDDHNVWEEGKLSRFYLLHFEFCDKIRLRKQYS